jgi:hypothetical protein
VGHYRLEVQFSDGLSEFEFTIYSEKIDRKAFSSLLEDLSLRLPAAVAIGLQNVGGYSGIRFFPPGENTLAQELVRLQRAVLKTRRPGLADVLAELARDHHSVLRGKEIWVQSSQARRPHSSRIAQAMWSGQNLNKDGTPKRLLDSRVDLTVDTYENRLINIYFTQVEQRLRRLLPAFRTARYQEQSDTVKVLLAKLARARRQAAFLDDVGVPRYTPIQLTMILVKLAAYRAAFEGFLELHKNFAIRFEDPALEAPLEQLPVLYQRWGALQILAALLEVAKEQGFTLVRERLISRDTEGWYANILSDGRPMLELQRSADGAEVKMIPEPTYGRDGVLFSITLAQRPDVVIEVNRRSSTKLLIFDPKYKLQDDAGESQVGEHNPKPNKADIDKMHAYRDAIRDRQGNRVAEYAAILYPGETVKFDGGVAALRAYPGASQDLQQDLQGIIHEALRAS